MEVRHLNAGLLSRQQVTENSANVRRDEGAKRMRDFLFLYVLLHNRKPAGADPLTRGTKMLSKRPFWPFSCLYQALTFIKQS